MRTGGERREPEAGHIGLSVSVAAAPDGGARVTIVGEFDQAAAPRVKDALERAIEIGGDVEVDMRACGFVDSTGIATLVTAARRLHDAGRLMTIRGARERVLRILDLAGLLSQHWIEIEPAAGGGGD